MRDTKWVYRLLLLLLVMLPTVICLILQRWIELDRPLFVYEYFFVIFLMAINVSSVWPWLFFVFVFLVDVSTLSSKLYLFNLPDFLNNLKYLSNYSISSMQFVLLSTTVLALIGVFFLFKIVKQKIGSDKLLLKHFLIISTIVFTFDNINGSSVLLPYNSHLNFYKNNLAGSPLIIITHSLINRTLSANSPILSPVNSESIAFKAFKSDDKNNQFLIIVESFGLINDTLKREQFQKDINVVFKSNNWKIRWGKTPFTGSTTRAELRELLNCVGDYRYFIKPDRAKNFKSIFQIKKHQGYHVNAIHSYKGNMFERAIWWKNIGTDSVYFSDNVQSANNFQRKLNYESPFISVNDEDAFDFIQSKTATTGKQFVYFLTENTHLPFKGKLKKPMFCIFFDIDKETKLSEEAKSQHKRISNFLAYVASNLDTVKFHKLLIVGDHMPPFVNKSDRSFYNDQYVPYCIVSR